MQSTVKVVARGGSNPAQSERVERANTRIGSGGSPLTAREYLNQVGALDALINAKLAEISRLRANAENVSGVKYGDKVQSCGNSSMRVIDRIIDLERAINEEIDALIELKAEVRDSISRVYNPRFVTILIEKYINGYTLEQIAERMNVAPKTVYRWHGTALQLFRKENNMK